MSLCGTDGQQRRRTTEDRATQPMEAGGWVSQKVNVVFKFLEHSKKGHQSWN